VRVCEGGVRVIVCVCTCISACVYVYSTFAASFTHPPPIPYFCATGWPIVCVGARMCVCVCVCVRVRVCVRAHAHLQIHTHAHAYLL
jgi:hypothetical protein